MPLTIDPRIVTASPAMTRVTRRVFLGPLVADVASQTANDLFHRSFLATLLAHRPGERRLRTLRASGIWRLLRGVARVSSRARSRCRGHQRRFSRGSPHLPRYRDPRIPRQWPCVSAPGNARCSGFKLPDHKAAVVSQVIAAAVEVELLKVDPRAGASRRHARYQPFFA